MKPDISLFSAPNEYPAASAVHAGKSIEAGRSRRADEAGGTIHLNARSAPRRGCNFPVVAWKRHLPPSQV